MIYLLIALLLLSIIISGRYLLTIRSAFRAYQGPSGGAAPRISVVIAAQNEEANLRYLIPALEEQEFGGWWEIIIVNDRSTDSSRELLENWKKQIDRLRVITIKDLPRGVNGKKNALTRGIREAEGDIILLTDGDCMPASTQWISSMAGQFREGIDIVLGFSMYRDSGNHWLSAFTYYETIYTAIQYLGFALTGSPYMGVGRNLAYRKSVFQESGGFDQHVEITGGDDDLFVQEHANSANTSVVLGLKATTWSNPKSGLGEYIRQKIRHLSVGRRYSPAIKRKLAVFTLSHIFGYIFMGVLMGVPGGIFWAAAGYGTRILLVLATFKTTCQKLEIPFIAGRILLMDLLFPFYYVIVGMITLFRKKIQWN